MTTPHHLPPVGEGGPFQIGGELWPGLAKLTEECGELLQVVGKVMAYPETEVHPDGTSIRTRLHEELADVLAIAAFVMTENGMDRDFVNNRVSYKLCRFDHWHRTILEGRGHAAGS